MIVCWVDGGPGKGKVGRGSKAYCYAFFPEDGLKGRECAPVDRSYMILSWYQVARRMGLQLETDFDYIERCYAESKSPPSACI